MSGKVFSIDALRQSKIKKAPVTQPLILTNRELFENVYGEIIDAWQRAAAKNKLNEFIRNNIPPRARGADNANYVGDLNALADAELKLNMQVSILRQDEPTWLVGFTIDKEIYSAPPIMGYESYARALNILLFVEFCAQLKKLKKQ